VSTAFGGFGVEVFEWFSGLEHDNSKAYFTATRDRFESAVRGELEAMFLELSEEFGGELKMFRQNRDVRFSPTSRLTRRTPTACCAVVGSQAKACTRRSARAACTREAATT
jgi:uncharacterized protein (DUF2461 family)